MSYTFAISCSIQLAILVILIYSHIIFRRLDRAKHPKFIYTFMAATNSKTSLYKHVKKKVAPLLYGTISTMLLGTIAASIVFPSNNIAVSTAILTIYAAIFNYPYLNLLLSTLTLNNHE